MAPEIRRIREDELVAFLETSSTAFLEHVDAPKIAEELKHLWDLDRVWAAYDGGRMCGTFRSWATELTLPGGRRLPAAAVAGVTVLPTHRRRGILRGMVAAEHAAARARGEPIGLLYSAEYPIYGRFGYGPGARSATWTLDALATGFHGTSAGGVELVKPDAGVAGAMRGVFDAWRGRQPGEIRRRDFRWETDIGLNEAPWTGRWKGYVAFRRDPSGGLDGYVRYHAEEKWERGQPRNILHVDDLHALTDEAYGALWRFLAESDLVATINAERRSASERLPWLLTNARAAMADIRDGLWVRLLDVGKALETRVYGRRTSLVLEVIDPEADDGRSRLLLEAGPDGTTARPTKRFPDLTLDVAALGAAYLGGTPLRHAVLARGADEHRPGVLAEADALFRVVDEPWCSTFF